MRWTIKPQPNLNEVQHLSKALGVPDQISRLLVQRDIKTFEEAKAFFRPDLKDLHDPFLMKDMQKAVDRIVEALQNKERILVYGDYDVDGTTSVALLSSFLETKSSLITTYIPDRYQEGYGVSYQGIDYASDNDISLIITLDCGIKAIDKVIYAKEKDIDFIICDHHRPGAKIPDAIAVLDPKREDCPYPYKELCGCGVGFKLIQAITFYLQEPFSNLIPYLDLVATAIAADIVPMTGENRILTYHGLRLLNTKPRIGFKALLSSVKKEELTITDVVFIIAPRINAAGRMKHGQHAVMLLKEEHPETARQYAQEIEHFNSDRRVTDQHTTVEALTQIIENNEEANASTVVYHKAWHKGVIGIVASRLTETYYRPTVVFTKSGDKLAASVRSVKGFDVYKALQQCADHLEQFGGHKYAAGLTLYEHQYQDFKNKFEEVVLNTLSTNLKEPEIIIDNTLEFSEITPKLHRILKQFAPFGPGNMMPVFMTEGVKDTGYGKCVGSDSKHLKATFVKRNSRFNAIGFNLGSKCDFIENQCSCSIAYTIDENEWNDEITLQLKVKDIKSIL
ncbi:single-stranded-DNA-specific exonuclease RecJ [Aquimarina sp. ERC-38]|uniref:single-stranded-DNA-specific exonuclease RecJ n=1 Tax=Aquimarina sp. ERC-38 TaxID=2949996 RepID=UPI002246B9A9|nr:single-stranded-DNA-specific exonuclease RecJ [Aquimarina sp. ERC-38]UZO81735.1 single-stranded-DNA-specific exonuclease RecJ [Aquimarina sp. ERC-38]